MRLRFCLLVLSVLVRPAVAQVWVQEAPSSAPSPRRATSMAFDAARGRVVLFGGAKGTTYLGDTWEWDGTTWSQPTPATSPPARREHMLVYDSARRRIVLFGGEGLLGTCFGDTWEWDGTTWTQVGIAGPAPRHNHAMAYDAARQRVVLFGGYGGNAQLGDTWVYDATSWTQLSPPSSPPVLSSHGMAYDAARQRTVTGGGTTGSTDTWEWDGSAWSLSATGAPFPSVAPRFAFAVGRQRVLMFGGATLAGFSSDTWEWDGTTWSQIVIARSPSPRSGHGLAYDGVWKTMVLFGGNGPGGDLGDTWTLRDATAQYVLFGAGCTGSQGVPALSAQALPRLGAVCTLQVGNLRQGGFGVILLGVSDAFWASASLPLPQDLSTIGMPGCNLLVSDEVVSAIYAPAGTATWSFTVPFNGWLYGQVFYNQAFVLDPVANPLGVAASNGGKATMGG